MKKNCLTLILPSLLSGCAGISGSNNVDHQIRLLWFLLTDKSVKVLAFWHLRNNVFLHLK